MTAPNNIFLIIIDQLRTDYLEYLPRCSALLPYHTICHINSIPASTEATHTTISTGKYPKNHGFISRRARGGLSGLNQLIMKLTRKELPSLASLGNSEDYSVYVIGGKEETVQVMGDDSDCRLKVHYTIEGLPKNRFAHITKNVILDNLLTKLLDKG